VIGSSHRTLREVVAEEIRSMILDGSLLPGERLLEDRLAEQLGVSRNPVREAIRALEGTGLVEVVPRRGAYVANLDPDQAHQLLELRSVIEAYAPSAPLCCGPMPTSLHCATASSGAVRPRRRTTW
jgi:DNA-binding GntR family transcriptional regulator